MAHISIGIYVFRIEFPTVMQLVALKMWHKSFDISNEMKTSQAFGIAFMICMRQSRRTNLHRLPFIWFQTECNDIFIAKENCCQRDKHLETKQIPSWVP